MKMLSSACAALLSLFAAVPSSPAADQPVPAGSYTLDKSHSSLIFRVNHLGISKFTGYFPRFDAQLEFDPEHPERASVKVTVETASLTFDNVPATFLEEIRGAGYLDAGKYPAITFNSTKVERGAGNELRIDGDLTLHGVTQPITLTATYNGGFAGFPQKPQARVGFSARGTFQRSRFGVSAAIPPAGSRLGVMDEVEIIIETEFNGPPTAKAPAG